MVCNDVNRRQMLVDVDFISVNTVSDTHFVLPYSSLGDVDRSFYHFSKR